MQTKIIYEDEEIIVVYKPAGFATASGKVTRKDVVSELTTYLTMKNKERAYLGIIHRLDQPVEGLLVFAKTKWAAADLSKQFGEHTKSCQKIYFAMASIEGEKGTLKQKGTLCNYLIKDNKENLARVVSEKTPQAKKAVLDYEIIEQKEDVAKVMITLKTGRFHQIRVQFSNAKMPLLGDLKYGTKQSIQKSEKLQVKTVALCAAKLKFIHPKTKKEMEFSVNPQNKAFEIFA